jgi:anti-anti-sigma factor
MPLTLESRFFESVYIVHCAGEIVFGREEKTLEDCLEMARREFDQIVIDLGRVSRLDSFGLGLLMRNVVSLRKKGGDLRISAPSPFVSELLKLTRLDTFLHATATEEEAIASFLAQIPNKRHEDAGRTVLLIDRSPEMGAFIRAVLSQHGYQVRNVSLISDAKMLLRFQRTDYVLFGPGTPESTVHNGRAALQSLDPRVVTLALAPDFSSYDAQQATDALLGVFRNAASA